jgi:enamine deaminase RidA (YjgF/YER057c/UK114 family)
MGATFVNPPGWPPPKGYNNGVVVTGTRTLCIAGQIGWDERGVLVSDDFAGQFTQALKNVRAVVEAAGGTVEQVAKLTIYTTDRGAYLSSVKQIGLGYREVFRHHFPAMAMVEVKALLEPGAMVEIEALAVLP